MNVPAVSRDSGTESPCLETGLGIRSSACALEELLTLSPIPDSARGVLDLDADWTRKWVTEWRFSGGLVTLPVRDLGQVPLAGCGPVRRFSWRTTQLHRPGLQFVGLTDRHHGFESLEEQRFLLALEFAGNLLDVLPQPFRLRFSAQGKDRSHTPDFLCVGREGTWLIDVRPADLVEEDDLVLFAAAAEAALTAGWRYLVVTGLQPNVWGVIDALSARRREMDDPLGLEGQLLAAVESGPVTFGELVEATVLPAVARAHAIHLLWHRKLDMDLSVPLTDSTPIGQARS